MLSVRLERGALWLALKNSKPDTDQAEYHKKRKKKRNKTKQKTLKTEHQRRKWMKEKQEIAFNGK